MNRIAKFEKVSFDCYKSAKEYECSKEYEDIKLPHRATRGSAGYDFYSPVRVELAPGEGAKIATGIRAKISDGWVLMLYPRSSMGFKYRLQLDNTAGVIDSDYYYSDNEGHIFIKITNDSRSGKSLVIESGEAFVQGIFMPFGITEDDDTEEVRNGGFGSTSR